MQLDLNLYPLLLLPSLPASNVHLVHNVHHFLKLYYFFLDDDSVFYLFSLLLQNHVFLINASCCICFLSILTTSQPGMSRQASFVKVKFRRKNMTNGVIITPNLIQHKNGLKFRHNKSAIFSPKQKNLLKANNLCHFQ